VRNTTLFERSDLVVSAGAAVFESWTVLERDELLVLRERIGVEFEEVTDSLERFERVNVPG
jgi:hypothetical protein